MCRSSGADTLCGPAVEDWLLLRSQGRPPRGRELMLIAGGGPHDAAEAAAGDDDDDPSSSAGRDAGGAAADHALLCRQLRRLLSLGCVPGCLACLNRTVSCDSEGDIASSTLARSAPPATPHPLESDRASANWAGPCSRFCLHNKHMRTCAEWMFAAANPQNGLWQQSCTTAEEVVHAQCPEECSACSAQEAGCDDSTRHVLAKKFLRQPAARPPGAADESATGLPTATASSFLVLSSVAGAACLALLLGVAGLLRRRERGVSPGEYAAAHHGRRTTRREAPLLHADGGDEDE